MEPHWSISNSVVKHNYSQNTFGGILWENSLCQDFAKKYKLYTKNKKGFYIFINIESFFVFILFA